MSPPWEFPSVPGSNSLLQPQLDECVYMCVHVGMYMYIFHMYSVHVFMYVRFLTHSQGSAKLNPLKCPPGFCPHVSAEFPRIHPTIQTLCSSAQECTGFDRRLKLRIR